MHEQGNAGRMRKKKREGKIRGRETREDNKNHFVGFWEAR